MKVREMVYERVYYYPGHWSASRSSEPTRACAFTSMANPILCSILHLFFQKKHVSMYLNVQRWMHYTLVCGAKDYPTLFLKKNQYAFGALLASAAACWRHVSRWSKPSGLWECFWMIRAPGLSVVSLLLSAYSTPGPPR